jgi:hypothetical protein
MTNQPDFALVAVTQEEMWQYLDCDQCGDRLCEVEANDTLDVLIGVARDHLDTCTGPRWTEPKTEILIHAWHVWESSGGFDWAPNTGEYGDSDVEALTLAHEESISIYGATSSALVTLKVAGYANTDEARQSITDLLEGELQDAIEVGRIGHIISRFNNEPEGEDQ